jgi:urea carboxylase-associated protein 2
LEEVLFEDVLQPGAAWTHILKRGTALRLTDSTGGANVGAVFYNNDCPSERLNIPDTLKAQHIARISEGNVLYSDMGRVLCSVTADSAGWHDPLGGCLNGDSLRAKYGEASYQEHRNSFYRNARDSFLIELEKYGLSVADLCPNVNFFSKVIVSDGGKMEFQTQYSAPGAFVELRAEMNVLVILSSSPHPMDPNPTYSPKQIKVSIKRVPPPANEDKCRISCPENERGFILTERYFL